MVGRNGTSSWVLRRSSSRLGSARRSAGGAGVCERLGWCFCALCVPSGAPTLIPSPTALLGLLDGSAVSGSDLILLCTTRTRLVPDYVQSLRRVRVRLMPRSPMMTKPPRVPTHSPILCSYCAPYFCDPDELCLMLFSCPGSYVYAFNNRPAHSRSVSISVIYSLLALNWARRPSVFALCTKQLVLLACCFGSAETYHGLSCSLSMYDSLNNNYTTCFQFNFSRPVPHNRIGLLVSCLLSFHSPYPQEHHR